jgi:hypothetical protein
MREIRTSRSTRGRRARPALYSINAVRARYGKKIGHRVGVVSASRKLARLIWSMLAKQTDFIDSPKRLTERKRATLRNRAKRFDSKENESPALRDLLLNLHKLDPEIVEMLAGL